MPQFNPKDLLTGGPNPGRPVFWFIYVKVALAFGAELIMLIFLYGAYAETMGLASDVYLADLPLVGRVFALIDDQASVSHLLAMMLAGFSVAVPILIWQVVLTEKVHLEHQVWLASPLNRVRGAVGLGLYAIVFGLEVVNLYTMIAQQTVANPFAAPVDLDPLTRFLAGNKALGVLVAILIAIVNLVIGFLTVAATHAVTRPTRR